MRTTRSPYMVTGDLSQPEKGGLPLWGRDSCPQIVPGAGNK